MTGGRPRALSAAIAAVTLVIIAISGYSVVVRQLLLARAQERTGIYLPSIVQQAIATRDVEVLELAARNTQTPVSLMEELFAFGERDPTFREPSSTYSGVRYALAGNPNTPSELLAQLARRPGSTVERGNLHYKIATNPNTPSNVLAGLANDPDELVRTWVCSNPRISAEVLLRLKNDMSARVRDSAEHFLRKRHVQ